MGGGGGILSPITDTLFGKPKTVDTPNYAGAAESTAEGNLAMARAATAANRVNQYTPWGSLQYKQTGTDQYGNPMWSAYQDVPEELKGALKNAYGAINQNPYEKFSAGNLPSYGINPGEDYTDAIMRRLQPQMETQQKSFEQQMANQGVAPGSEAYNNAYKQFAQAQNDQRTSAQVGGMDVGLRANQQQYAQNLGTYNTNMNMPFQYANAIKGLLNPNYINPYSQQATAGADYMGAMGLTNQSNIANANAYNAQNNAMMSGLFGLGGAGIMKWSDIRIKENIKSIGQLSNGLPVYEYEYKADWKDEAGHGKHIGVMAQDVEKVIPYAVVTMENGFKKVRYDLL